MRLHKKRAVVAGAAGDWVGVSRRCVRNRVQRPVHTRSGDQHLVVLPEAVRPGFYSRGVAAAGVSKMGDSPNSPGAQVCG